MNTPLSRRDLLCFRIDRARKRSDEEQRQAEAARVLTGLLRPPGALEEPEFARACDGCGACVSACPEHAIQLLGPENTAHQGTPAIDPCRVPCRACAHTPCIAACETGALTAGPNRRVPAHAIHFQPDRCWAARGQPCDYCVDACPQNPPAVRVVRSASDRSVVIDANRCVGCGLCIFYCTATPRALEALTS